MGCVYLISEPSRRGPVSFHLLTSRRMGSECFVILSCNWFLMYNLFLSRVQESLDSLKEKISPNSVGQGNLFPHLSLQQTVEGDPFNLFFFKGTVLKHHSLKARVQCGHWFVLLQRCSAVICAKEI